tara:strand:+ start:554 stop:3073 length:2520 start_codon:yes stop_codon:yes gene_type:complete
VALKKPSELFGKKGDNSKISENINGNLNNIKQQFDKVEELKKELEGVTNSIDNSLSKVVDNSVNFVEFKEEYSELIDNLNVKIEGIKEDFDDKIDELRAAHLTLNTEITILDKRQNSLHIRGLKDEVIEELQNILNGNVYQNIRSLEEKFDSINEKQLQNLQEGLLNEPPNVDNSDPLTPLDKKYVTLDEFQEQYKLFINRIQKQLSTFGGGGAVRIQDLDDVDISTAKVNDKFLKYDASAGKWVGAAATSSGGGGSGITTEFVSAQNLNVVGLSTFVGLTTFRSDIHIIGNQLLNINDALDFRGNNGGNSFINHYIDPTGGAPGNLYIGNLSGDIENDAMDNFSVKTNYSEQAILATKNGSVALYHDGGNKKIETSSTGVTVTGTLSATSYSGDGSGLTGITGSGSGVVVQHDGSNVGTAGTINFSTNLDVTAIHAGIVTVTATGGGGGIAGINTVGLSSFSSVGVAKSITFNHSPENYINHIPTFGIEIVSGGNGEVISYSADNHYLLSGNSMESYAHFNKDAQVELYFNNNLKFETNNTGAVITGVCSATSYTGSGVNLTNLTGASSGTYGNASAVPVITVDGNGRITGISTIAGSGSGITNVVEDTSPQLGGNLDVNGKDIVSVSNGDIELDPNGSGKVVFKGNATKGSGQIKLNCEQNSHGIILKGPPHSAAASYTLTLPNNIVNGQFLKTDGSGNLSWAASGTASRTTTNASTGSIAQAASANITIPTPGKTISLLKVAIDAPAYVILYTDSTSRSNDASRSEGTDPTPGSGVLTEVSTTTSGASTFLMTPAVLGWNNDGTPANQIYAKVVNKRATSGSNTITVTLTSLALES